MKCTCGHPDNYNFSIDNGLCNSCIEEKLEQLEDENKRLREYIQTIGEYAYAQHGDTKAFAHRELYRIATMCRDKQVEQALEDKKENTDEKQGP